MTLSGGEKLILAMLVGIYKKLEIKDDTDPNVILAGIRGDTAWILQWQYGDSPEELPPKVKEARDILDMYRLIEASFKVLNKSEKERVTKESAHWVNYFTDKNIFAIKNDVTRYAETKGKAVPPLFLSRITLCATSGPNFLVTQSPPAHCSAQESGLIPKPVALSAQSSALP